jgi:prepilin signal peptidase PulO-like enzyme (type II secretory pathway)
MDTYFLIAAAMLGAIAGSFINALSYRFNTGRGMGGRSYCDTCGHTLGVFDLVPIFSYLFLRGRCRYCRAKISVQNLLVEVAAAALSALSWQASPSLFAFAFWFAVWMMLLFVVVYDLKHTIIPWRCSILLGLLALVPLFFSLQTLTFMTPSLYAILAGPALALPLFLLSLVSSGRWMGWGDSALELSLGWFLGLSLGTTALMLAFWSGAILGLTLVALKKGLKMGSELPFAPFLVLGMFLTYFFHVDFFSMVSLW